MKKLLLSLVLIGTFGGFISIATASDTDCKEVNFDNGVDACVNINDAGSDERELETDLDGGSEGLLRCDIMTPDSILVSVPGCNGTFEYDENDAGRIKLWIRYNEQAPEDREGKPSSNSQRTYPQRIYDFDDEGRLDDNLDDDDDDDDDDDNNNGDVVELAITDVSDEEPNENQRVDITVEARDNDEDPVSDYENTIKFKVQVWDDDDDERTTASSSDYELDITSYTFDEDDEGEHEFTELVRFKDDSEDYRLVIYDDDDDDIDEEYQIFDFGNGYDEDDDDNNDNDEDNEFDKFTVTTDDSTPTTSQFVDIIVEAKDGSSTYTNYRGTAIFKVYKRSTNSSSWSYTTSDNDFTMKSPYDEDGYDFTSSNRGKKTFSDLIKFKRDGYEYKVVVLDDDDNDIQGYKTFTVDNDNDEDDENDDSDTDNFYVTTDDGTPTTSQFVDLTVKARNGTATDTSYRGTVFFEVYYKASGSSTWVKTTSSSYYEMEGNYEDDGYTFTSSNNGTKTFSNIIKFKRNNYSYKVVVYDEDEEFEGYKVFTIGSISGGDSDVDGFTASQLRTVESILEARPNVIDRMESQYSRLRNSSRRQNMSDDLEQDMEDIVDDKSSRTYEDFDAFYEGFLERYRYTVSIR